MYNMLTLSEDMQCSVFFTISFTFLFTWVFIQLMAFSGPINFYLTGIPKPYPHTLFTSFLEHVLQLSCHGKLLPQI